ncbi:hypothetical protein EGJ27_14165 [Pseudomonas sp. v388]|uniref:hypothetical protein n=1 Tax=Pseudomonas sp. v388 TaxID=2479849 RepID=UPI000F799AFA|nr:hypothetical protein [Pseudomonas sp. v388]RRV06895.1 hypothetical protein EGJ27_14165 [Pseudomonas sp. v388]
MLTIRALQAAMDKTAARKAMACTSQQNAPAQQTREVQISGQALLKQRLFDFICPETSDAAGNKLPPALPLTHQDTQLLGDIYEWARVQGAELGYVDSLGRELAGYRSGAAATPTVQSGVAAGAPADPKATSRLTFREDAAVKRILAGEGLKSTRLDAGFIRHAIKHPPAGRSPYQLEFMERVIDRFSAKGDKAPPLGSMFTSGMGKSRTSLSPGDGGAASPVGETASRPKPLSLESLRLGRLQAAMRALGVSGLSQLWDNPLGGSRFRR